MKGLSFFDLLGLSVAAIGIVGSLIIAGLIVAAMIAAAIRERRLNAVEGQPDAGPAVFVPFHGSEISDV